MPDFEDIVRPFQNPDDVAPPKQGNLTIPAVVPPVIVIAGGSGSGKILDESFDETSTAYVVKRPQEKTTPSS